MGFLAPPTKVESLEIFHEQARDKEAGTPEAHCTTQILGEGRAVSDPLEVPTAVEENPVEKQDVAGRKTGTAALLTADSGCCFGRLERLPQRTKQESNQQVNTKEIPGKNGRLLTGWHSYLT